MKKHLTLINEEDYFYRLYMNGLRAGWHPLIASCEAQKQIDRENKKEDEEIYREYRR